MPSGFSARFAGQNENWPPSGNQGPVDYPHSRILPDAGQNRRTKGLLLYYTMECGIEQPPCKTRAIRPHFFSWLS